MKFLKSCNNFRYICFIAKVNSFFQALNYLPFVKTKNEPLPFLKLMFFNISPDKQFIIYGNKLYFHRYHEYTAY